MALTQDTVLSFLLERGGKVKNSELVSNFKGLLNSGGPAEKKQNRELFKRLVNNVAVVQQVGDVKYVAVKKKHLGCGAGGKNRSVGTARETESADVINNNYRHASNSCRSALEVEVLRSGRPSEDSLAARALNVTSDARSGKTGVAFALVAVKSPSSEDKRKTSPKARTGDAEPTPERAVRVKACRSGAAGDGVLYRSPRAEGSPHLSRCSRLPRSAEDPEGIPLGATEHEWLVRSATGSWRQVYGLLLQEPRLALKASFVSGFTVLHWAAKSGNGEMVRKVIDVSRQRGAGVEVDAKSYDGYTALHIAAIHGHERVISVLAGEYGASAGVRDNSVKKPYRYLRPDASVEVRKLLGDPRGLQRDARDLSELPGGFNALSKLLQPQLAGRKKKHRCRPSFRFVGDDRQDPRKNVALDLKLLQ
ncbi:ankyrin repeat domain-containing protein SOWAHA [Puntigrus tetrazona]|uniref:ankyrin repeat domain-containing protein SOWAHA n=1 Tax=Puntigrus tetrazona TaxID=1606681 RepID=UPI001C8AEF92|nr:ankyrin repeat domain-containing protein SOWAHA [Puntigrus tetrazona]